MASGSIGFESNTNGVTARIDWRSTAYLSGNYSLVDIDVYIIMSGYGIDGSGWGEWKENGVTVNTFIPKPSVGYGGSGEYHAYTKSGIKVNHDSNGNGSISLACSMSFNFPNYGVNVQLNSKNEEATIYMDKIARYTNVSISQKSKDINSISVNWASDDARDHTQYRIKEGSEGYSVWKDARDTVSNNNKSGYFKISNLKPNTSYKIQVQVKRTDSQLWSSSNEITITTYDYAKFTNINNSNFGDNISITKTSESGLNNKLELYVGTSLIAERTSIANSYTLSLSQSELDNLYKKYEVNSNILSCTYKLITNCNSVNYTDSVIKMITLTGNAKTAKIKQNSSIKRAKVFIKQNGVIKKGVLFTKENGTIKRCI